MLAKQVNICKPSRATRPSQRAATCTAALAQIDRLKATAAAIVLSTGLAVAPAFAAGVSFTNISSGATVASPVHLDFAVDGLTVKPAAEGLAAGTGHHHILIDVPPPAEGEAIPFDNAHKHFGKGQTSVDLELAPGKHTLILQFANALHESYGLAFANTIVVEVK